MNNRAVLYARVSTDEQSKGYSLSTQLDACRIYAESNGFTVDREFKDAHTGTELERPGLNELYQFIETTKVGHMIVYDLDRLSREVGIQAIIEMEMTNAGIHIDYVLGQYAETPDGELLKLVKSGIAQFENRIRTERSRRGKIGKAKAGFVICPAGRAPFGYDYISEIRKGSFEVNEAQAIVVRKIYSWLVDDGLSSYAIAKKLWEESILSKGDFSDVVYKKFGRGEWSPSTVRNIISSPVYKGEWWYNKTRRHKVNGKVAYSKVPESEWILVKVPPIVEEDIWSQAQVCLEKNRQRSQRNTRRQYLLRGMVFCPCGRRWTVVYKTHLQRAYYRCPTNEAEHWRKRCAYNFSIRQEVLENAVWNKVADLLLDREALKREVQHQREETIKESDRKVKRLNTIDADIQSIDRKLGVLLDELLNGSFTRVVINERRTALEAQRNDLLGEAMRIQEELQTSRMTPEEEEELLTFADQICTRLFHDPTFEQKRRILEIIDLRVDVISRDKVKISGCITPDGLIVNISSA